MRLSTTEHNKRLNLYNKGLTDQQIAQRLNVPKSRVCDWRKAHNLPYNTAPYFDVGKRPMRERLIVRHFLIQLFEQNGGVA